MECKEKNSFQRQYSWKRILISCISVRKRNNFYGALQYLVKSTIFKQVYVLIFFLITSLIHHYLWEIRLWKGIVLDLRLISPLNERERLFLLHKSMCYFAKVNSIFSFTRNELLHAFLKRTMTMKSKSFVDVRWLINTKLFTYKI